MTLLRFVLLSLLAVGCQRLDSAVDAGADAGVDAGVDAGIDAGIDAGDVDAGTEDAGVTARPASAECINPERGTGICEELRARDWTGERTFRWRRDANDQAHSVVTMERGGMSTPLLELRGQDWHVPWGLSVRPDGGLYLSGSFLGTQPVSVGGQPVSMPHSYNMVVLSLSAAGALQWHRVVEGVTSERVLVVSLSDGDAVVAGDLNFATTVGSFTLRRPEWLHDFFLARLGSNGDWRWAAQTPAQGSTTGDFALTALEVSAVEDLLVQGAMRRTLMINGASQTCTAPTSCPATLTFSRDGGVLELKL